jgi:hypothetical protein
MNLSEKGLKGGGKIKKATDWLRVVRQKLKSE